MNKNKKGFTLVELIIVIAIIAILAGMIFVAIDPARRFHESNNARRASDVTTILDALKTYQADHKGAHYSTVDNMSATLVYQIGTSGTSCAITCGLDNTESTCVNLAGIETNYMATVPFDPKTGSNATTHYSISKDANGALAVQACDAEGEGPGGNGTPPVIKVVR